MRCTRAALIIAALLLAARLFALGAQPQDPRKQLHALFEEQWEELMRRTPVWASQLGDRRYNDRWEDVSLQAIQSNIEHDRAMLRRLKEIDPAKLAPGDRINYRLFEKDL